ncbi:DNA polymerase III subunit chi [Parachitinimonas caeni]|uniref:DNA polymerase III subunit chi n=1 Tax=Parachitinimonas caeni TaxID=3031301 RepID=A0ABT7DSP5_9NEIS|nr:DNA polymerase III subunit chi [Parachitinimonas caeni]MDK2123093.1 DNA polymerase III subunit chi [Parachitinimonas caeni]
MSQITFYFNPANREHALCVIAGKALARRLQVVVATGSPAASEALDRLLWEVPTTGFLPHCAADAAIAAETPILVDHRCELLPVRDVLINWTDNLPPGFERFGRVIEIVDADNATSARARVGAYKAAGHTVDYIDLTKPDV